MEVVMFAKLVVLTIIMAGIFSGLLMLRQQRLEVMNESAVLHAHIHKLRKTLWRVQTEYANRTRRDQLMRYIRESGLALEPAVPYYDHTPGHLVERESRHPLRVTPTP